ncbi:MAG: FAD-binding protein [Actinobacteria bacterium]|nr:FAD-binding protein [Actinomycetota bacterium]
MAGDTDFDLVVVGCGGAGLSAAVTYIETAGDEARVAVLERATREDRGGSTRWTMAGLRVDSNFVLDPQWVGRVQEVSKNLADLEFCLAFEREIPNTGEFLRSHGVEVMFREAMQEGMPRTGSPNGGGLAIVDALARYVDEAPNAAIFYETEAIRLSVSDEGRVDGVVVRGPDGLLRTLHAPAVVLACGGFEGNYEMLTQYCGRNAVDLRVLAPGTQFNKGDGIRMATEIGAATSGQFDGMHAELVDIRTDRADAVLNGHNFAIAVNGDAARFYDEGAKNLADSFELIAYEVWKNQDQQAFFIVDEAAMSHQLVSARFDTDIPPAKADNIRDLAAQLGLDPDALEQTVNDFNAACAGNEDREYDPTRLDGKATTGIEPPKSNWANPISHPPYYGFPVAAAICFTYGGLKTDTSARVVSKGGVPIPNLYAAGELVGLFYHEYPAATSVLKALTFGRLAGAHAAAEAHANALA